MLLIFNFHRSMLLFEVVYLAKQWKKMLEIQIKKKNASRVVNFWAQNE